MERAEGWGLLRSSLCGRGDPTPLSSDCFRRSAWGLGRGPSPLLVIEGFGLQSPAELELGPAAPREVSSLVPSSSLSQEELGGEAWAALQGGLPTLSL